MEFTSVNDRPPIRSPTKRSSKRNEKFEVYFAARTRKTNADRRSNLMVVRREKVKSDAVIVQKKRKMKFFEKAGRNNQARSKTLIPRSVRVVF